MLRRLIEKACRFVADRVPYRVIPTPDGRPYLVRYYLLGASRDEADKGRGFNVFLHLFLTGDEEPELHSHPWKRSMSLILTGGYREERRIGRHVVTRELRPGMINVIAADDFHRVELLGESCWTLFIAGHVAQSWGFWDRFKDEYIPWREQVYLRRARRTIASA